MNQDPITITYSLEEVLGQINSKLDNLQKEVTDIKIQLVETRAELKGEVTELRGEIRALDEKVDGLSKRLDNQEFVNRGILVALVVVILGSVAKLLGWVGNP